MTGGEEQAPRPDGRTWATVAVGLLLLAAWLLGPAAAGGGGGRTAVAVPAPGAGTLAAAADHPAWLYPPRAPLPAAKPVRLDIASIGVHAEVVGRGLRDGTVDPPPYDTPDVAGWYRDGPAPGAPGAALIVGHVDTRTGTAVFYGLSGVRRGAPIEVTRADGTIAQFSVEAVETVEKDHFDPDRVYGTGATDRSELRLITCGGSFDRTAQTYSANVVVYAALTGARPA